jgi:hypothetical protein
MKAFISCARLEITREFPLLSIRRSPKAERPFLLMDIVSEGG